MKVLTIWLYKTSQELSPKFWKLYYVLTGNDLIIISIKNLNTRPKNPVSGVHLADGQ
jgi:hypothetical protein